MGSSTSREDSDELGLEESFVHDLKENTHFKSKEIREWHEKFKKDFPSGHIRRHEFRKMYSELTAKDSNELADYVFDAYDQDRNGRIDFKEFMTTLSVTCRGSTEERLYWVFDMYDIDGTGALTRDEVIKVLKAVFRMKGKEAAEEKACVQADSIFQKLDKDKDGLISKDEFCNVASKEVDVSKIFNIAS
ncbi:DgyrCDS13837 [Dimorphilus gyrociliatus]|uniref:DgyrCDS13837 n=1 Tax=Dimorphilus gyrociliatus TaxID=2664684 RepID=A0A7I8WC02_9ANNE|nr:DgyrCDS13837 [Dimorphilus gyrociliatus]